MVLIDLQESKDYVENLKAQFKNCNIYFKKNDISKKSSVCEIFKRCVEKLEYIDIVVNCAGIMNEQEIEQTYQTNIVRLLMEYDFLEFLMSELSTVGSNLYLLGSSELYGETQGREGRHNH